MLNIHSTYSLKYGTVKPEEILRLLQELGYESGALTDINNTSACLDFLRLAPKYAIRPAVGIDFRNSATPCFVGLALNNEGYKNLNDYLAFHLHQELPIPRRALPMPGTLLIYPFQLFQEQEKLEDNEYIGLHISDLNRLRFSPWLKHPHKLVILYTMTFRHRRDFNMHRLLRAMDKNLLLSKLPKTEEGKEADIFIKKETLYA